MSYNLDQYYTKPAIAKKCFTFIKRIIPDYLSYDIFLEPSAGTGNFFNYLPKDRRLGLDLDPHCENVIQQDF